MEFVNSFLLSPSLRVNVQIENAAVSSFLTFRSYTSQELRAFVQNFVTSVQKTHFVREQEIVNKLCWIFSEHKLLRCT